jgi:hypothetical protein
VSQTECIPLRRSLLGALYGPVSFLPVVFAPVFVVLSVFDPSGLWFALPTVFIAAYPLFRPLRLCGGDLVVPGVLIVREFRLRTSDIERVELAEVEWGGWSGYKGFALILHAPKGPHLVLHSLYCGRKRLEQWAATLQQVAGLSLTGPPASGVRKWREPSRWPVI